jgi:hypothetical protein
MTTNNSSSSSSIDSGDGNDNSSNNNNDDNDNNNNNNDSSSSSDSCDNDDNDDDDNKYDADSEGSFSPTIYDELVQEAHAMQNRRGTCSGMAIMETRRFPHFWDHLDPYECVVGSGG